MPSKGQIVTPALERFQAKVFIDPVSGCWLWTGATESRFGYGKFRLGGASINAHRASWELFRGPIPAGMFILHKCDVPACVNPDHLFLGTQSENNKDRAAKGRTVSRRGEDNDMSVLREADVIEIRRLRLSGLSGPAIAARFEVNHCAIYDILNGITWRHVA